MENNSVRAPPVGKCVRLGRKKGAEMGANEQAAPSEISGVAVSTHNLHILAKRLPEWRARGTHVAAHTSVLQPRSANGPRSHFVSPFKAPPAPNTSLCFLM